MATIPLVNDPRVVTVDDDLAEELGKSQWRLAPPINGKRYVMRVGTVNGRAVFLHRLVVTVSHNSTFHMDGDTLNNRRANLSHSPLPKGVFKRAGVKGFFARWWAEGKVNYSGPWSDVWVAARVAETKGKSS